MAAYLLAALLLGLPVVAEAPPAAAAFSGTNGAIAFNLWWINVDDFGSTDRTSDIWVTDPAGSEPPLRLDGSHEDWHEKPDWSPDGNRLAFVGYRYGGVGQAIYTMNADGSNVRQLTNSSGERTPRWSPDGQSVAFVRRDVYGGQLWLMDADGTDQRPVLESYTVDYPDYPIAWLPDGRLTFFGRPDGAIFGSGLWVADADADADTASLVLPVDEIRSAADPSQNNPRSLDWSPDGTTAIFSVKVPNTQQGTCQAYPRHYQYDIWAVDVGGSDLRPITNTQGDLDIIEREPTWSPDGTKIAFAGEWWKCTESGLEPADDSAKIYMSNDDGSERQLLIDPPYDIDRGYSSSASQPTWQPCTTDTTLCGRPPGAGGYPISDDVSDDDGDEVPDSDDVSDNDGDEVPDSDDVSDDDGDGVPNNTDNCPAVANGDQADSDGNGIGDACEPDPDADPAGFAIACPAEQVPPTEFFDLHGNVHADNIECIVWYELTLGTTPTTYSPGAGVTRDQMASFIARLMERAGVVFDEPSDQGFTDIAGNVHAHRINQLAALDVVRGTSATTYDPRRQVRRDQMASFLVRAYETINAHELERQPAAFTDVAGNTHLAAIEKAATAGFAHGTSATTYAPSTTVRRDQMGSFLARVLERGMTDGHVRHPAGN